MGCILSSLSDLSLVTSVKDSPELSNVSLIGVVPAVCCVESSECNELRLLAMTDDGSSCLDKDNATWE